VTCAKRNWIVKASFGLKVPTIRLIQWLQKFL